MPARLFVQWSNYGPKLANVGKAESTGDRKPHYCQFNNYCSHSESMHTIFGYYVITIFYIAWIVFICSFKPWLEAIGSAERSQINDKTRDIDKFINPNMSAPLYFQMVVAAPSGCLLNNNISNLIGPNELSFPKVQSEFNRMPSGSEREDRSGFILKNWWFGTVGRGF